MRTYKEIFKTIDYPELLNTMDDLKISKLLPWEFLNDDYAKWKLFFENAGLIKYAPIARMINDDVVATLNIESNSGEIFLFTLPILSNSEPFKKFDNMSLWLKIVLDDCYEYITNY